MVKSTQAAFPSEGVELRISADEALAQGIKPGDPAVVEVNLRPPTAQEWIAEGSERTFETEDEVSDFFAQCPVPGPAATSATVEPAQAGTDEDYARIRWTSAAVSG